MAFSTLHLFTNNKLLIWIKNKSYLLQLLLSKSLPVVHWGKVFNVKRQQQFQQIDTVQKNFQYACRKAIGQQLDCFLLNTKVPRSLHISTLKRGFFLLQPLIDLAKYMFFFFLLARGNPHGLGMVKQDQAESQQCGSAKFSLASQPQWKHRLYLLSSTQ